jgi:phosphoserine phosphatase
MKNLNWQLTHPLDAIIFDCDGTLSTIEGINELAKNNHVGEAVVTLTHQAMSESGMTPEIYAQRLALTKPTHKQVLAVAEQYIATLTPDTAAVIEILQKLNKSVYIMSAGIQLAVEIVGKYLQVPKKNIYAVKVNFDNQGHYHNFDHDSPLVFNDGKQKMIEQLKSKHQHISLIGDGLNDFAAKDNVTRFIGYGGTFYRQNLAKLCEFYITAPSMAGVLPLTITQDEFDSLPQSDKNLYEFGLDELMTNQ